MTHKHVTPFSFLKDIVLYKTRLGERDGVVRRALDYGPVDYVFLAHPRSREDIFGIAPFLRFFAALTTSNRFNRIAGISPVYAVSSFVWDGKPHGLVVSTTVMPEPLVVERNATLAIVEGALAYLRKISRGPLYVGLGAWWPIATNNGKVFQRFLAPDDRIKVSSGHATTVASLYLTAKRVFSIGGKPPGEGSVCIAGVGRVGTALADMLKGEVGRLGLLERNPVRMESVAAKVTATPGMASVGRHLVMDDTSERDIAEVLSKYDITICTTSNLTHIVRDPALLHDCLIIDDARPEAFPRVLDLERKVTVLEGGMIKLPGLRIGYDFGWGCEDNVPGCLAEAALLALDRGKTLRPVVGNVETGHIETMLRFLKDNNITEGDLLCGHRRVTDEEIKRILEK
jgi:predicted amino acid dehydrogenase